MKKRYLRLIDDFESARIKRDDWHHLDHLIVGLVYIDLYGYELALKKMRDGLQLLLRSFDLKEGEDPYNETMTVFWMKTLQTFYTDNYSGNILLLINTLRSNFPVDYHYRFYSRDLLNSPPAKAEYLPPDKLRRPE
ncbi:MAG: hypothetical protein ACK5NT_07900 [Pyrinomonadaceae bacterium]